MRKQFAVFYMILVLTLPAIAMASQPPADVMQVFGGTEWDDYSVAVMASFGGNDQFASQYALIMKKEDHNVLCIVEKEPNATNFQITVQTDSAIYQGDLLPSLLIDTGGDALFYTYRYDDANLASEMVGSIKQGGTWGAPTLFLYYGMDEDGLYPETQVFSDSDSLVFDTVWCDENGNIVRSSDRQSIGEIMPAESLADFNITDFHRDYEVEFSSSF